MAISQQCNELKRKPEIAWWAQGVQNQEVIELRHVKEELLIKLNKTVALEKYREAEKKEFTIGREKHSNSNSAT